MPSPNPFLCIRAALYPKEWIRLVRKARNRREVRLLSRDWQLEDGFAGEGNGDEYCEEREEFGFDIVAWIESIEC